MTEPDVNRSARCSGRVEPPAPRPAGTPESAPESMSPRETYQGVAERQALPDANLTSSSLLDLSHPDLSSRDLAIVSSVGSLRFLTTEQLQALHFADHATATAAARICRRVLHRLAGRRLIEPIARRIGGVRAGSSGFVWRLGAAGDRLLRRAADMAGRARRKEPSLRYLDHCLTVVDCYVRLVVVARRGGLELLRAEPEPACWRRYLGAGGGTETLKPDFGLVTASDDYEDHWFLEIDRATESLPTVLRKCEQYARYEATGREQADAGVFPRVLWIVPDLARAERLRTAFHARPAFDALCRVLLADELTAIVRGGAE